MVVAELVSIDRFDKVILKELLFRKRKMDGINQATVLTLCPNETFDVPRNLQECFWQLESDQGALEIMRIFSIDLLLVSLNPSEVDTWQFIRKVKIQDSKAKWVLLCYQLDSKTEIQARTLGVLRIFQTKPDVNELYNLAMAIRKSNRNRQILA